MVAKNKGEINRDIYQYLTSTVFKLINSHV
jgi:hypothetical protein